MDDIIAKLKAPFDPTQIHFRVGSTTQKKDKAMGLAYLNARDVMERLDDVVGPENWQCTYPHAAAKVCCELSIKIGGEWVTKSDGAGDTNMDGNKGAFSDAFKRAAVRWGIGRYLYGFPNNWYPIQAAGKSWRLTDGALTLLRNDMKAYIGGAPSPATGDNTAPEKTPGAEWAEDAGEAFAKITKTANQDRWLTDNASNLQKLKNEDPPAAIALGKVVTAEKRRVANEELEAKHQH